MTTQPPEGDLATQAAALTGEVEQLRAAIVATRTDQARLRRLVRQMTIALVCIGVLAIGFALVAVDSRRTSQRAEDASSLARRNSEYNRLSCEIGNESRAGQRQLWGYVLDLSTAGRTLNPTERKQLLQFRAYVDKTFAPRDCTGATPTVLPPTPTSTPTR